MKMWEDYFEPKILRRGHQYFLEGHVARLRKTANGYCAVVRGTENYRVEIQMDGDMIQEMTCDCPYSECGMYNCKHMAAVLYKITSGDMSETENELSPEELVKQIPEEQLRQVLTEILSEHDDLYQWLLLRYGDTSLEHCLKALREERDAIGLQYADSQHGYVEYQSATPFAREMAGFIQRQAKVLLGRGELTAAFQMGMDSVREYVSYDIDESDGSYGYVMQAMEKLIEQIANENQPDVTAYMFSELLACLEQDHNDDDNDDDNDDEEDYDDYEDYDYDDDNENWFMQDFADRMIFEQLNDKVSLEKKLAFLDQNIQDCLEKRQTFSYGYPLNNLLVRRLDVMKKLELPEKDVEAFLKQYVQYPDVRKKYADYLLEAGRAEEAVLVLQEGKDVDGEQDYVLTDYSKKLIELYQKLHRPEDLLQELEYYIFALRSGDISTLLLLKSTCKNQEQWEACRERYIAEEQRYFRDLLREEELWDRLLQSVTAVKDLSVLDRYEKELKAHCPVELRDAYIQRVIDCGDKVSNRSEYYQLIRYLVKIRSYPDGEERAREIAADWQKQYRRRRAMMEELRNAGF